MIKTDKQVDTLDKHLAGRDFQRLSRDFQRLSALVEATKMLIRSGDKFNQSQAISVSLSPLKARQTAAKPISISAGRQRRRQNLLEIYHRKILELGKSLRSFRTTTSHPPPHGPSSPSIGTGPRSDCLTD